MGNMNFINKDQLIAELYETAQSKGLINQTLNELPNDTTPTKIIKYLTACIEFCETQMKITGMLNIPLTKLRKMSGRYNVPESNGKKDWVWYLCQRHLNFFVIRIYL